MRIIVRADSGTHIGNGHVMRCMTLAKELKQHGHEIIFLTRNHHGSIHEQIKRDFQIKLLDGGIKDPSLIMDGKYLSWLGVSLEQEIEDTNQIINKYSNIDLAIIDHYALDQHYEKSIKAKKILVIDDLMNREHYCDYLLDQNLSADLIRYKALCTKEDCHFMLGPKFALLKPEFRTLRPKSPKIIKQIENILIFFGGSDITRESRKVIDAYKNGNFKYYLKFILNKNHPDYSYIKKITQYNNNITLTNFESNMAQTISKADLCFGACGSSSWERACLGVPSCVVVTTENQHKVAKSLYDNQAILLKDNKNWTEIFNLIKDVKHLNKLAQNSFDICDGEGVNRITKEVFNA